MLGRVDIAFPQVGHEQLIPAKDVERQEAVAVVIAVEEPPLLLPMHRSVRRIKVQDQIRRRLRLGADKLLHQLLVHRPGARPVLRIFKTR